MFKSGERLVDSEAADGKVMMQYTRFPMTTTTNYKHSNFLQYSKVLKDGVKKMEDFHCITKHDERYGFPIWNKLNVVDVCKDYDKVGIVDCDTMINITLQTYLMNYLMELVEC